MTTKIDRTEPKSRDAIRREIGHLRKALARDDLPMEVRSELYGAYQALSWVVESNTTMRPEKAAMITMREVSKRSPSDSISVPDSHD